MHKAISKVFVLTIMFVAFLSQAMAFNTAASCGYTEDVLKSEFVSSEHLISSDSTVVDLDNREDCCGIECCDLDCSCIGNTCSSVAYFNINAAPIKYAAMNDVAYLHQLKQPKTIPSSLYRPPIFFL